MADTAAEYMPARRGAPEIRPVDAEIERPGGRRDALQDSGPAGVPTAFTVRLTRCPTVVRCEPGFAIRSIAAHSEDVSPPAIGVPRPEAMSNPGPAGYRPPLVAVRSLFPEVTSLKF